jgi:hypothetical protein
VRLIPIAPPASIDYANPCTDTELPSRILKQLSVPLTVMPLIGKAEQEGLALSVNVFAGRVSCT